MTAPASQHRRLPFALALSPATDDGSEILKLPALCTRDELVAAAGVLRGEGDHETADAVDAFRLEKFGDT
jgi:hypothetical protein